MIDPLTALSFAFILFLIILVLFWPDKGIIAQFKTGQRNTERVMLEDTLKQLYDHEYRNKPSTLKSISGALEFSQEKTALLLNKLTAMGLASYKDMQFSLTKEGRRYALRIIRMHRLWERYFADETGLTEIEWHKHAELREHETTKAQADLLASKMNYPSFDPHGDPIPTEKGEMPPQTGKPLPDLDEGESAYISHLEDEPTALYSQLIAEGLYPGLQIQILEKDEQRIRLSANNEEIVLAPIVANNISVIPISKKQEIEGPFETLFNLQEGESGEVISISKACRGLQRRRLMDLGIIPGTKIKVELQKANKNPTAYNIRGALIALRSDQAKMINIKKLDEAA